MAMSDTVSELELAQLVDQLGRCAAGRGFSAGLNPAQWTALRYFARANRFSRTVSGFARYHGTTRGTASQTVKSLVQKGYLIRRPLARDQRSFRLELTARARRALASDPLHELVRAARSLPRGRLEALGEGLRLLLERVLAERECATYGICRSCRHSQKMPNKASTFTVSSTRGATNTAAAISPAVSPARR